MLFTDEPKMYASFAFESDQKWDWPLVQRKIIDLPHNKLIKDSLSEEEQESYCKLGNRDNKAWINYVQSQYDPDLIQGTPLILTFETINPTDLKIISKKNREVADLVRKAQASVRDGEVDYALLIETIFSDSKLHEKFKSLLIDFLDAKVVHLENSPWDRKKILTAIAEKASVNDMKQLFTFLKALNKNNVLKKKILKPSAE